MLSKRNLRCSDSYVVHSLSNGRYPLRGFTILEVLIALTLSLLLMLSLTQAFKYLSERIRENRTAVELSTRLNNSINLLEEDLKNITVPLRPQVLGSQYDGYFVYYEGPGTDATSILFGGQPTATASEYYRDSRFGDFDDYLAFTAYSPNKPFRGFVPKYILLANSDATYRDRLLGNIGPALTAVEIQDAIQPATITSHYAEIIYWVGPALVTDSGADGLGGTGPTMSYDAMGSPIILDVDSDNYPDRLTLHRRVLLIRPDLNLPTGHLPKLNFPVGSSDVYTFMEPDPWPGDPGTANFPRIIRTGPGPFGDQRTRAWQIGMAPVHQQCDLSIRWVLDANGMPTGTAPGSTPLASANSLADLTQPHNRFAHVRAPNTVVGFSAAPPAGFTTMPILAVGSQLPYLTAGYAADANGLRATAATFTPSLDGPGSGIQSSFSGFLRPEFSLGSDYTHTEVPGTFWGRERLGDDILSTEVLAFDLQAFDPFAAVAFGNGLDGAPGTAGLDDDGNGTVDDAGERGSPNSDDTLVTTTDPFFFVNVRDTLSTPASRLASRGEFVDLAYDRLTGGAIRSFTPVQTSALKAVNSSSTASPIPSATNLNAFCASDLSGYRDSTSSLVLNPAAVPLNFVQSGKLLMEPNAGVRLFQPTYDTFTTAYERDGRFQYDANRVAVFNNPNSNTGRLGTVWWVPHTSFTAAIIDRGADGLDNLSGPDISGVRYGDVDGIFERETSAPFDTPISAVRVRIRLQDQASGVIQQQSVVADSL